PWDDSSFVRKCNVKIMWFIALLYEADKPLNRPISLHYKQCLCVPGIIGDSSPAHQKIDKNQRFKDLFFIYVLSGEFWRCDPPWNCTLDRFATTAKIQFR
ncbi:MAG: hypothetical protein V6Z86_04990, partial [Hyphomicrobiales bacterium]